MICRPLNSNISKKWHPVKWHAYKKEKNYPLCRLHSKLANSTKCGVITDAILAKSNPVLHPVMTLSTQKLPIPYQRWV